MKLLGIAHTKTPNREITMTKEELIKRITDANSAYRSGNPFISDGEYDELVEQFQNNYPDDYDISCRKLSVHRPSAT